MRVLLIVLSFHNLFTGTVALASRVPPPAIQTQSTLSHWAQILRHVYSICGRFPTTAEGLKAANERPKGFSCPNQSEEQWELGFNFGDGADGWRQPLKYESDGSSYRILASHGYFATDKSPLPYWENPNGGASMPPLGFYHWYEFFLWLALIVTGTFILITWPFLKTRIPERYRHVYSLEIALIQLVIAILWLVGRPTY